MNDPLQQTGNPPSANPIASRAALWTWILGVAQVLFSGCLSSAFAVLAVTPLPKLLQEVSEKQPESVEVITTMYPLFWPMAGLILVMGFIPGVAYIVAGFGVRKNNSTATYVAMLLAITQTIVLGVLVLSNIVVALSKGDLCSVTFNIIVMGTMLAMIGYTALLLYRTRRGDVSTWQDQSTDPWDEPSAS